MDLEPWRGEPVGLTAHAIVRWLERVGGVELGPMRRVASALFVSKKASDKAVLRLIEVGFELSLDPIRLAMRRALDEGEIHDRGSHVDVHLPDGFSLAVTRNPKGGLVVLTVLSPGMLVRPEGKGSGGGPAGQGDCT